MKTLLPSLLLALGLAAPRLAAADQAADLSKPVQVFILLGQSNMVGLGKVTGPDGSLDFAVKNKKKYPHLVDAAGNWSERADVRNVRVMVGRSGGMQLFNNEFLKVTGKTMGPEYGIGHPLGDAVEAPVMLLKSCIGNRSLGWDLLPPGSERYVFEGKVYAGYKDRPDTWAADAAKGTGTTPPPWVDKAAFYERLHDVEQQKAYVKRYAGAGDIEGRDAVIAESRDKLGLEKAAHASQKAIADIRRARDAAWKAKDRGAMDDAEYRERVTALKEREREIVMRFNRIWMERIEKARPE